MNNNTLQLPKTQAFFNKDFFLSVTKSLLQPKKRRKMVVILDYLIGASNINQSVYVTQDTIARHADLSLTQTHRNLKFLEKHGLITMEQRTLKGIARTVAQKYGHANNPVGQTSNLYFIHPLFNDMDIRNRLKDLFSMLTYLPLVFLTLTNWNTINADPGYMDMRCNSASALQYSSSLFINKALASSSLKQLAVKRKYAYANCLKKRKERMKSEGFVFPPIVEELATLIGYNTVGKCNLLAYHERVLELLKKRWIHATNPINSRGGWTRSTLEAISADYGYKIERRKSFHAAEMLDIKLSALASVIEPEKDIPFVPEPSKKSPQKGGMKPHVQKAYRSRAPEHVSFPFSIDELRSMNPEMVIQSIRPLSASRVKIHHHYDTYWRETTQEERTLWTKNMQELNLFGKNELKRKGMPLPPAPLMFHGDPNNPGMRIYHVDEDGVLHLPNKNTLPCKHCGRPRPMTPENEKDSNTDHSRSHSDNSSFVHPRPSYSKETIDLLEWFRKRFEYLKEQGKQIPSYFEAIRKLVEHGQDEDVLIKLLQDLQRTVKHDNDFKDM